MKQQYNIQVEWGWGGECGGGGGNVGVEGEAGMAGAWHTRYFNANSEEAGKSC